VEVGGQQFLGREGWAGKGEQSLPVIFDFVCALLDAPNLIF